MDENESNVRIAKTVVIGIVCVLFVGITGVTSCSMYGDQMEAVNKKASTEYLKVEMDQQKAQNASIQTLVEKGTNPVAARCAIIGWETERDAIVCTAAGAKNTDITTDKPN